MPSVISAYSAVADRQPHTSDDLGADQFAAIWWAGQNAALGAVVAAAQGLGDGGEEFGNTDQALAQP